MQTPGEQHRRVSKFEVQVTGLLKNDWVLPEDKGRRWAFGEAGPPPYYRARLVPKGPGTRHQVHFGRPVPPVLTLRSEGGLGPEVQMTI